jgi:hypothetical protein
MIKQARSRGIKVILLTPTGDISADLGNIEDPLNRHAELIRNLAQSNGVGLADSLAEFRAYISDGGRLEDLMSQENHPNRKGHELVVKVLMKWF